MSCGPDAYASRQSPQTALPVHKSRGLTFSYAAAAVAIIALLSACASALPPPSAPTSTQIASAAADLNATGISPADYASIGITLSQKACADWFSSQVANSQASSFGTQALSTIGGIGAATGTPPGVGVAAGMAALSGILGAAQSSFGAGANPAAIYGLIERVQQAWLAVMPAPLTSADAYALVESFAEQCSLPNIQNAVTMALTSVPVVSAHSSWVAPRALEHSWLAPAAAVSDPQRIPRSHTQSMRRPKILQSTDQSSPISQQWDTVTRLGRAEAERRIIPPQVCVGGCR